MTHVLVLSVAQVSWGGGFASSGEAASPRSPILKGVSVSSGAHVEPEHLMWPAGSMLLDSRVTIFDSRVTWASTSRADLGSGGAQSLRGGTGRVPLSLAGAALPAASWHGVRQITQCPSFLGRGGDQSTAPRFPRG